MFIFDIMESDIYVGLMAVDKALLKLKSRLAQQDLRH